MAEMRVTAPPSGMPSAFTQSTCDDNSLGTAINSSLKTGVSAAWPVASTAYCYPFVLTEPHTYQGMWWFNGATASAAVNGALFDNGGNLVSGSTLGSIGQGGATTVYQSKAFGAPVTVGPGTYFMGLAVTTNTDTIVRANVSAEILRSQGVRSVASFFVLNANIGSVWVGTTGATVPVFGLYEGTWR